MEIEKENDSFYFELFRYWLIFFCHRLKIITGNLNLRTLDSFQILLPGELMQTNLAKNLDGITKGLDRADGTKRRGLGLDLGIILVWWKNYSTILRFIFFSFWLKYYYILYFNGLYFSNIWKFFVKIYEKEAAENQLKRTNWLKMLKLI